MKCLKLTNSTEGDPPIWINMENVTAMKAYTDHRGRHDYTEISFIGGRATGDWEQVRETPEQILQKLQTI